MDIKFEVFNSFNQKQTLSCKFAEITIKKRKFFCQFHFIFLIWDRKWTKFTCSWSQSLLELSFVGFPPSSIDHFYYLDEGSWFGEVVNRAHDDENPGEEKINIKCFLVHRYPQRARRAEVIRCDDDVCWCGFEIRVCFQELDDISDGSLLCRVELLNHSALMKKNNRR